MIFSLYFLLLSIIVLTSLVNVLYQHSWFYRLEEEIKTGVGAVMRADERYQDMVLGWRCRKN
jgi:hypothetical protein